MMEYCLVEIAVLSEMFYAEQARVVGEETGDEDHGGDHGISGFY